MSNINDFKLLNIKCMKYYNILNKHVAKELPVSDDKSKERLGFYLFMLESICNIKDTSDTIELITDKDFNKIVFGENDDDHGIDAVYIDEENYIINLFNFKYREKFNADAQQRINDTIISTKFTNAIINEDTAGLNGKIKVKADKIIDLLKSKDIWKIKLYIVSNESKELDADSPEIRQLKDLYDLETVPFGLNTISKTMSIVPSAIDAILHLEKDAIMPFSEDVLSSSKSYVIKLSAPELIRITCDNKKMRNEYNMEDLTPLSKVGMEYNLLFDNVRGLILKSKYNKNIYNSLAKEPTKFFMYNNGLTITASDIISEETNANKKIKITIKDFQVVNGGQSLRTIHNFNSKNSIKDLSNCEVLVRIFKTTSSKDIKNKIAEYTNSQNSISNIDLKSLSSIQIQIEQFLDEHNIIYARKIGDTGLTEQKEYIHKISMEKFGQILFSIIGFPEKASNQKGQIFDKYYDKVFGEEKFDINKSSIYIKRFFEIKKRYDANDRGYKSTDQKVFFILYLDDFFNRNIDSAIDYLENTIIKYKDSDENLSEGRILIQSKFKSFLDSELKSK